MTAGNVMFVTCVVSFVVGTYGLVKDLRMKHRQRQQEKHYAAMREAQADNE